MAEAKWYVVHTYSGYENKVKANIDKTIENRHLEDEILEVRVPMQEVVELKNGVQKASQKKMFPGYVLIHMIMNDDTWYVVRNTRGVTGFVGPGSKPVPLTDEEMAPLGIQKEDIVVDFEEGDTVTVTGGAWEGTVGMIQTINMAKQSLTINVDLFGRETPVEISFAEVKKMMLRHAKLQLQYRGEYTGIREMRKHVAWYTAGFPHSAKLRKRVNEVESMEALEELLQSWE